MTELWEAYEEADQKLEAMRVGLLGKLSDDALNDGILTANAPKAGQVTVGPGPEAGFFFERHPFPRR